MNVYHVLLGLWLAIVTIVAFSIGVEVGRIVALLFFS